MSATRFGSKTSKGGLLLWQMVSQPGFWGIALFFSLVQCIVATNNGISVVRDLEVYGVSDEAMKGHEKGNLSSVQIAGPSLNIQIRGIINMSSFYQKIRRRFPRRLQAVVIHGDLQCPREGLLKQQRKASVILRAFLNKSMELLSIVNILPGDPDADGVKRRRPPVHVVIHASNLVLENVSHSLVIQIFDNIYFGCLESLNIEDCPDIRSLEYLRHIASLKRLGISNLPELRTIDFCVKRLGALVSVSLESVPMVEVDRATLAHLFTTTQRYLILPHHIFKEVRGLSLSPIEKEDFTLVIVDLGVTDLKNDILSPWSPQTAVSFQRLVLIFAPTSLVNKAVVRIACAWLGRYFSGKIGLISIHGKIDKHIIHGASEPTSTLIQLAIEWAYWVVLSETTYDAVYVANTKEIFNCQIDACVNAHCTVINADHLRSWIRSELSPELAKSLSPKTISVSAYKSLEEADLFGCCSAREGQRSFIVLFCGHAACHRHARFEKAFELPVFSFSIACPVCLKASRYQVADLRPNVWSAIKAVSFGARKKMHRLIHRQDLV
ncbi:hypothetical protein NEDG_01316 [Nematocida displodere]|uniref:Uncharacterized protein n=1 Tax=Nematocida displodere TaxID=1805483 RepID=A0A177EBB6_9MICR|nr:hypothetical protein NEDG_01316 [Nematocida displodere]